jgi:hypothetical protein
MNNSRDILFVAMPRMEGRSDDKKQKHRGVGLPATRGPFYPESPVSLGLVNAAMHA